MCDGIAYKAAGPDGKNYFAKCAYLIGGEKCGFQCLPFHKKWKYAKPKFYCLTDVENGNAVFERLVSRGTFVLCDEGHKSIEVRV